MLTPEQISQRIQLLECLRDMHEAIEFAEGFDNGPDDDQQWQDVTVTTRNDRQTVCSVLGLPPAVVLAGLRAMRRELEQDFA